jgi:hypothetical protein
MGAVPSYWPAPYFAPRFFAPSYWGGGGSAEAALLPDPTMTLRPVVVGFGGRNFQTVTPDDEPVPTFNACLLLAGRTIARIVSFAIECADAASAAADSSPGSRIIAGPAIDETDSQVMIKIGNLQAGVACNYRLTFVLQDIAGRVFTMFAVLPVLPRTDAGWMN